MKKLTFMLFTMIILLIFTGCAADQDARNDETNNVETENVGFTNTNDNDEPRMRVADRAAERVSNLTEVRQANVIVTDENAYVAVILADDPKGKVTRQVEEKISQAVKGADRDIENVYVSTNPDFIDRMADYGDQIERGEPIEGLVEEFTEMTRRVFPSER